MDEILETPKNVDQLDTLIDRARVQKEQKASYFILSLLLPPLTIYLTLFLSWRRKLLFRTLPAQLIFYSAITLVFNLLGLLPIQPPQQVTQLGVLVEPKTNTQVIMWTIITTVLALVCFVVGYYFKNKAKKDGALNPKSLWILFFFLNLLVYGVIFLMVKEASLFVSLLTPTINSGYQGL